MQTLVTSQTYVTGTEIFRKVGGECFNRFKPRKSLGIIFEAPMVKYFFPYEKAIFLTKNTISVSNHMNDYQMFLNS